MTRESGPVRDLSRLNEHGDLIAGFDIQQDEVAAAAWADADNRAPAVGVVQFAFQGQS